MSPVFVLRLDRPKKLKRLKVVISTPGASELNKYARQCPYVAFGSFVLLYSEELSRIRVKLPASSPYTDNVEVDMITRHISRALDLVSINPEQMESDFNLACRMIETRLARSTE